MIDAPTATLIAAVIAAFASIITLILKLFVDRSAESRATYRKHLEPLIEDLGNSLHMIVACSILSVRDRENKNQEYWEKKKAEARASLRKIRSRIRYQLWGLDDGVKALICLPDWVVVNNKRDYNQLLDAATRLRRALDQSIRHCYLEGRPPSIFERLKVSIRVQQVRRAWEGLKEAVETEDLVGALRRAAQVQQYDKLYATIVEIVNDEFVAKTEEGERFRVKIANRSGKGSRSLAQPGVRIKLYQREGENFFRYRFLGG